MITNVPALNGLGATYKDQVYTRADINVYKADHIRLRQINVDWNFKSTIWGLKNASVSFNVTNLGILWRANKLGLDPDINDLPRPRQYSFAFRTSL